MTKQKIIESFHAHVYFDESTMEQARQLCETAQSKFDLTMGHMHERPVGPHPRWSCQLAFAPQVFGEVIPWLATHRNGLVVFIHTNTGDDLKDHTEHAMWMEAALELNLEIFR